MEFEFRASFDRRFKKLTPERRAKARSVIEALLAYLDHQTPLRAGLGLKNFKRDYWEIRIDLHDRIVFELSGRVIFWMVGNHDEIRRFMKEL